MITSDFLISFISPTLTTIVFFSTSALISLVLATFYIMFQHSQHLILHVIALMLIEVSRGIPTVVFVVLLGNLGIAHSFSWLDNVDILPGVAHGFTIPAFYIIFGLGFSSSGHMARIIEAALSTIRSDTRAILLTINPPWYRAIWILFIECAPSLIPTIAARLVHHLHNSAFIAMFPVTGIFAAMRTGVIETSLVIEYIAFATFLYVVLGFMITWIGNALLAALKKEMSLPQFQYH